MSTNTIFHYRQTPRLLALASLCFVAPLTMYAAEAQVSDEGIGVSVTGMGGFTLGYPVLQPGDLKPVQKKGSGKHAEATYAGEVSVQLDLVAGNAVEMRFKNAKGIKSFTLSTLIGAQFGDGGTWVIGKGEAKPFPADKPAKPHLFQGNAGGMSITDAAGHVLTIEGFPDFAYQQLTDNREWGWKIFNWQVSVPYNPNIEVQHISFSEAPIGADPAALRVVNKVVVQVDRFGQTTRKDFPGKIKDEAELKADVASEAAYYASYKPMTLDSWGGLPGTKAKLGLQATGFFHTEKKGDRWLLVDPDGNANFHLGVCCMGYNPGDEATYIKDRQDIYEWIPPLEGEFATAFHPEAWWHKDVFSFYAANVIRKFGAETSKDQQVGRLIDRVRAVGFNAVGAFSGFMPSFAEKHIPRMEHLGFGADLPGIRGVADNGPRLMP